MENCNRHNSGKLSRIHLKLGIGGDDSSSITGHDFKVKRSKFKVTRAHNV